ncbi:alpha-hydroxy-acid oxidizing protein [Streptomyces sp. ISL-66]|uniref:glutamate synthase-related protein n=1 Tax=Streptomyces sp. ISL-66 TaxID=2819186 RepID=UPI001BEBBD1A|nr:glutamate synthase-related protein [Streptomyces sp. ISL-66]MBT2472440.1 alpha-hydroxy-acid oxidizing protein [Streptomyces sp. ISL-66]
MTGHPLGAPGYEEEAIRDRARRGAAAAFPEPGSYGRALLGAEPGGPAGGDPLDRMRIVPPVFVPQRLEKLFDLGEEPLPGDVVLATSIGGFFSPVPLYVSAFGSTQVASSTLGEDLGRQAGRLGIPMVIGENVVPVNGYGRGGEHRPGSLLARIAGYLEAGGTSGGIVVQQSTQDADAEVWNMVYSDPTVAPLLESGRLAFELKVGQGAKPGLGGITLVDRAAAGSLSERFQITDTYGSDSDQVVRCATPGTFTEEILTQQIRLMRNNYPRCRVWVKLPPGRDIARAVDVALRAGADAVSVDGAEGGTGWAPRVFLSQVGLGLGECLTRIRAAGGVQRGLLASGRMWEGGRALKALALGADAVGLGRAALLAVAEDPREGLVRLVEAVRFELQLLISALGKYDVSALSPEDLWLPESTGTPSLSASLNSVMGKVS